MSAPRYHHFAAKDYQFEKMRQQDPRLEFANYPDIATLKRRWATHREVDKHIYDVRRALVGNVAAEPRVARIGLESLSLSSGRVPGQSQTRMTRLFPLVPEHLAKFKHFMQLPGELRNLTYSFAFHQNGGANLRHYPESPGRKLHSIIEASRQVRQEALYFFWSAHHFVISVTDLTTDSLNFGFWLEKTASSQYAHLLTRVSIQSRDRTKRDLKTVCLIVAEACAYKTMPFFPRDALAFCNFGLRVPAYTKVLVEAVHIGRRAATMGTVMDSQAVKDAVNAAPDWSTRCGPCQLLRCHSCSSLGIAKW